MSLYHDIKENILQNICITGIRGTNAESLIEGISMGLAEVLEKWAPQKDLLSTNYAHNLLSFDAKVNELIPGKTYWLRLNRSMLNMESESVQQLGIYLQKLQEMHNIKLVVLDACLEPVNVEEFELVMDKYLGKIKERELKNG